MQEMVPPKIPEQLVGNKEVIELLERTLERARTGQMSYCGVAFLLGDAQGGCALAGRTGSEPLAQIAVKSLYYELERVQRERMLGERNHSLDDSYFEYPLSGVAPLNWDFLVWLIDAEMTRIRLGGPAPLKVWFSMEDKIPADRVSFVDWVIKPLVEICGGIIDPRAEGGRHKRIYVPSDIVARSRGGQKVPRVCSTAKGRSVVSSCLHGDRPVVITLREAPHLAFRNSNLEAWTRFARDLERAGEKVVFVRDTAKAFDGLEGLSTFPKASLDLPTRVALYEQAKVNMFVSNGPGGLAIFSGSPYVYLTNVKTEYNMYEPNSVEWWSREHGLEPGDQWPWATPEQITVWANDDYETICGAWERWGRV